MRKHVELSIEGMQLPSNIASVLSVIASTGPGRTRALDYPTEFQEADAALQKAWEAQGIRPQFRAEAHAEAITVWEPREGFRHYEIRNGDVFRVDPADPFDGESKIYHRWRPGAPNTTKGNFTTYEAQQLATDGESAYVLLSAEPKPSGWRLYRLNNCWAGRAVTDFQALGPKRLRGGEWNIYTLFHGTASSEMLHVESLQLVGGTLMVRFDYLDAPRPITDFQVIYNFHLME